MNERREDRDRQTETGRQRQADRDRQTETGRQRQTDRDSAKNRNWAKIYLIPSSVSINNCDLETTLKRIPKIDIKKPFFINFKSFLFRQKDQSRQSFSFVPDFALNYSRWAATVKHTK